MCKSPRKRPTTACERSASICAYQAPVWSQAGAFCIKGTGKQPDPGQEGLRNYSQGEQHGSDQENATRPARHKALYPPVWRILICVRYRRDTANARRLTTVELIVDEGFYQRETNPIIKAMYPNPNRIVYVPVGYEESGCECKSRQPVSAGWLRRNYANALSRCAETGIKGQDRG